MWHRVIIRLLILLMFYNYQVSALSKVKVKMSDFDKVRLDKKGYNRVKDIHYAWYLHSIKALMGQLGKDLYKKLNKEQKHRLLHCLNKIEERRDIVSAGKCLVAARDEWEAMRDQRRNYRQFTIAEEERLKKKKTPTKEIVQSGEEVEERKNENEWVGAFHTYEKEQEEEEEAHLLFSQKPIAQFGPSINSTVQHRESSKSTVLLSFTTSSQPLITTAPTKKNNNKKTVRKSSSKLKKVRVVPKKKLTSKAPKTKTRSAEVKAKSKTKPQAKSKESKSSSHTSKELKKKFRDIKLKEKSSRRTSTTLTTTVPTTTTTTTTTTTKESAQKREEIMKKRMKYLQKLIRNEDQRMQRKLRRQLADVKRQMQMKHLHKIKKTEEHFRVKRSPYRLIADMVQKSDSQKFTVKNMDKAPALLTKNTSPVRRVTNLIVQMVRGDNSTANGTLGSWTETYKGLLNLKKSMDKRASEKGAKVYDLRMYDLVLGNEEPTMSFLEKAKQPEFIEDAYNLVRKLTGKKGTSKSNFKFLSPRFAPIMPDKYGNNGALSPSVLSFYNDDAEEQILPLPKLMEASGMDEKDRSAVLEMVMEISGARETVDGAMKTIQNANLFGMEGEILEVTQRVKAIFDELSKTFKGKQKKMYNKRGYTFMEPHQIEKLHEKQGISERKDHGFDIEEYKKQSPMEREEAMWLRIRQIASNTTDLRDVYSNSTRHKRQITWLSVLQPTVLAPYMFSPVFGLTILGPVVLSPSLFSPLILNPAVLSPYVLSTAVGMPFILSPYLLSPYVISPLVFAPFILNPYVLSPNVINPYVLSPLILSPVVLGPDVLSPMVLGGGILSPTVLSPSVLSPSVLMASVLSPSAFSKR